MPAGTPSAPAGSGQRGPRMSVGGHELGELRALHRGQPQQRGIVADPVGAAVVGQPVQRDRVVGRRGPAGEPQVQPVFRLQEQVGAAIGLRLLVLQPQNVRDGVLAAARGDPAGRADPPHQLAHPVALYPHRPARHAPRVRRATGVHPDDGIADRAAALIDCHRPRPLRGAGDGGDRRHRYHAAGHQPRGRPDDQGPPPLLRVLLGAAAWQELDPARLLLRRDDLTRRGHQRHFERRGPEVDRQDVARHAYTSNIRSR